MSLLLDVLEVFARRPARRIALTHVAQAAGELRQPLAIRMLAEPFHGQVRGLEELRPRQQRDLGLVIQMGRRHDGGGKGKWRKINGRRAVRYAAGDVSSRSAPVDEIQPKARVG